MPHANSINPFFSSPRLLHGRRKMWLHVNGAPGSSSRSQYAKSDLIPWADRWPINIAILWFYRRTCDVSQHVIATILNVDRQGKGTKTVSNTIVKIWDVQTWINYVQPRQTFQHPGTIAKKQMDTIKAQLRKQLQLGQCERICRVWHFLLKDTLASNFVHGEIILSMLDSCDPELWWHTLARCLGKNPRSQQLCQRWQSDGRAFA